MASPESKDTFRAPVLLTVFNRPKQTEAVFQAIRAARPPRLYLAADGPRSDRDLPSVDEARRVVMDGIDWDCEVKTLLRPTNLGLQRAMREAITWFFEQEEEGIVLEDDCVPNSSFFQFCEAMLDRYRDDPEVMHVGGNSYLTGPSLPETYRFSVYPLIWGWATWADAWSEYLLEPGDPEEEFARVEGVFSSARERRYWKRIISRTLGGQIESWSLAWCLALWRRRALAVVSTRALVRNVGFTSDAVHTKPWKDFRGLRHWETSEIEEVEHPAGVRRDEVFDLRVFDDTHRKPLLPIRAGMAVRTFLSGWWHRFRPGSTSLNR